MGAAGTRGYEISSSSSSVELRQSRKAYECEELGEAQAFLDDLNYLIGGLSSASRLSERCLTLIKLGEQCLSSEFRMSLRSSSSGSSISCDASTYYLNRLCELLADSIKYKVNEIQFEFNFNLLFLVIRIFLIFNLEKIYFSQILLYS